MKLSICLATYNEENNLGECLDSIKNIASEIIVVDGGSSDQTVTIARSFKAKVIETSNPPIFHINKQKAIDAANGDWILQLDADEQVNKELATEIMTIISANPIENGFWIKRKNFFLGQFLKKGGQYPDPTLRLYRRGMGKLPCRNVHEQAIVEGRLGNLNKPLLHFPYRNFAVYLEKWNRYTNLDLEELRQKKTVISVFSFINFFFVKPVIIFSSIYLRHLGFIDGFPGLVFALFSGLRFPAAYTKYWEIQHDSRS